MYIKYTSTATHTMENVLADLVKLITGTTNLATLSANCDQANTMIIANTIPAGWTLHDDISIYDQVVKAPHESGSIQKYAWLSTGTGYISIKTYQTWDNVAHTGTIQSTNIYLATNTIALTVPFTVYLFVTPRYIIMKTYDNTSWSKGGGFLEVSRASVTSSYYGEANGKSLQFTNILTVDNGDPGYFSAIKNPAAVGELLSTNAPCYLGGVYFGHAGNIPRMLDETKVIATSPLYVEGGAISSGHIIGQVAGKLLCSPHAGGITDFDEFSYNSEIYIIMKFGDSAIGVLKG